jgi:hypothetical protein
MALSQPPPHVLAPVSISLSSFTPILPHELWREVFQLATFIPGELELSATFCPSLSVEQQLAWENILPLRVAIQSVSRLWHAIGVELLYRSFHDEGFLDDSSDEMVQLLALTLRIKPSYGMLVKRLALRFDKGEAVNADRILILRSCPKVLILSTNVSPHYIPVMQWDPSSPPTSLRHLEVEVRSLLISNLLPALAHLQNLELLALSVLRDEDGLPPAPAESIVLPSLRLLHLNIEFARNDILTTERIFSLLSLPCLTSLSLSLYEALSAPSLCKDLLRRLTYLRLGGADLPLYFFQAIDFPLLHIFQLDTRRMFQGTLLSECPNLPIQQLDLLTLSLPGFDFPLDDFTTWSLSLHCVLTEARDPALMPKLKRVVLEEEIDVFDEPKAFYPSYEDLVSCYGPLADAFESRGVELSLRFYDGPREVDVPVRDFILQMDGRILSSSSRTTPDPAMWLSMIEDLLWPSNNTL